MNLRISAIVPTHNRSTYLRKALTGLVQQSLENGAYEIIVIDNKSTDETKQLVLEEFREVTNLRYIYEPNLGLNIARNTGWKNGRGEFVAYTDDDAIPSPEWLEQMLRVWADAGPNIGCIGGPVEPIWEAPRPDWLGDKMLLSLTIMGAGTARQLDYGECLLGANMSFPRHVLEELGGFQEGLDRIGSKLLSNGEVLFERRLDEQGYVKWYDPRILVRHHVPATRLTQSWFARRAYWQGVSDALISAEYSGQRWDRYHLGLYRLRQIFSRKYAPWFVRSAKSPEDFSLKYSAFSGLGTALALFGIAR